MKTLTARDLCLVARYIFASSDLAMCYRRLDRLYVGHQKLRTMPTSAQIGEFLKTEFPQTKCTVQSLGDHCATVRHPVGEAELRPGGTVSGPVLMAVADVALYVAIMGEIGIVPLVVSTSLTINFMRKPAATSDLIAVCKLLKVGKTLAVGEVSLYSEGVSEPVAHAVGTYAIPSRSDWLRQE